MDPPEQSFEILAHLSFVHYWDHRSASPYSSHEDLIDCTQPSLGALKEPQPSTFSSSDPHAALLPSSSRRKSATSASHIPSKSSTLTTKPQAAQRDSTTEGKALKKELAAAQEKVKELERKLMQSERAAADKARSGAGALKKEMLARDGEIRRLEGVVEEKKARCQAMETAYQDSESRRQELEQSTGQMRELFDLGDVGDVQRIVTGLQDLNDAIDEIVFAFVSQLNEHLLQEPLPASLDTFAGWRAVSGRFNAQHFLASVRRSGGNDIKLDDFLHPFLKVVITEELFQVVLGAFHPLIWEASTSSLLQKLYQQVKLEGRWIRVCFPSHRTDMLHLKEIERGQPNGVRLLSAQSRLSKRATAASSSAGSETPSYRSLSGDVMLRDTTDSIRRPS